MEFLRLTGPVVASSITTDVVAVVDAMASKSMVELLELCHVAWALQTTDMETDQEIATHLSGWEPWASDTQSGRETTVAARRTTLDSITT